MQNDRLGKSGQADADKLKARVIDVVSAWEDSGDGYSKLAEDIVQIFVSSGDIKKPVG